MYVENIGAVHSCAQLCYQCCSLYPPNESKPFVIKSSFWYRRGSSAFSYMYISFSSVPALVAFVCMP